MKKALFAVISAVMFASCSFWNEPVEEFFSYWSSEAFVTDSSVKVPNQSDKAGVVSVSSDAPAEVILNVSNPKSFRFVMPAVGNSEMIRFGGLETQPVPGTDYTLTQMSSDALKLTYKTAFLKQHEWGNGDLGATLTLFADDGRKFKKPYGFNLKANTPPPTPTFILAKTDASPGEYVLCLKVAASEMTRMVNGELLHKDIAKIDIGGSVYDLTVNAARTDFVKPADAHFINYADAAQLTTPLLQPAVPLGAWVLYYKTGVSVGSGAYKEYPVRLMDEKGLVSETLTAGTATTEPPAEIVTVTAGEQGTGSGTSDTDPFVIKVAASAPEARLEIKNVAGTTVHCTVTEVVGTAAPARYDGNPVTFTLNGANDKLYKVEYYTDGTGFKRSQDKTKYYKVAKSYTITFSVDGQGGSLTGTYNSNAQTATSGGTKTVQAAAGETISFSAAAESADYAVHSWTGVTVSPPTGTTATLTVTGDTTVTVKFYETTFDVSSHTVDAWKKLKELIAAAPAGGTLKISGTIQSTIASDNNGEIIIDKDLTIEAPSVTATLDANSNHSGPPPVDAPATKHRIFRVKDGKTLTLKNLTLINGYAGKSTVDKLGTTGGGIRLESGTVSLSGVTISGCKAITTPALGGGGSWHGDGGGIYVVSGNIIMENTTLSENDASAHGGAVYMNGGTLTMKGSIVITPSTGGDANITGKNDVHLKDGAKIIVNDALTGTGTVARIGVAYNEYLTTRQVLGGAEVGANHTRFTVTDQGLGTDNGGAHVRKWKIKSDGYLKIEGVTLDGSKTRAWQALKDAVRTASDGDVIAISGEVKATNEGTGIYINSGEIVIDKNLTIKKADGATSAILNANSNHSGPPPADAPAVKHRIFTVRVGSTLTLDNITLQGGMAEGSEQNKHGGGVYVDGKLIMKGSSTITDCSAAGEGGGLFLYGTCTLQDSSSITHCEAGDYGGGVFVDYSGTSILNINGGSITMNHTKKVPSSSGHGGGVYVRGNTSTKGKVYMTSGEISGNKAGYNGGSTYGGDGGGIYNGGIFEMSGGVIKNNTAKNGGGVYTNGVFEITGGTFSKNTATSNGGAIYSNSGTVTLNNATIGGTTAADANKAADYGGGIYIDEGCSLTLKDGAKVIGNTALSGGGVYNKGGSFEMTGGEIKSNTAKYGGGVYVKGADATLTMSGGTISENKAEKDSTDGSTGGDGGGVYIDGAKFTLKLGTTISNNTADKDGGGVTVFGGVFTMEGGDIQWNTVTGTSTVQNSGHAGGVDIVAAVMNMSGGKIKNNTAKNGGGGVSIALSGASNSVLNMSGGTISGNTLTNTAGGTGKGVEFFTGSTTHDITYYTIMKMSGSAKVDVNNDVYLTSKDDHSNEIRMITVDGELTGTAPVACITPKNYSAGLQVLDGSKVGTEHIKFTVTRGGSPAKNWYVGSNGKLTDDPAAIFNAMSKDKIKAFESNLKTITVDRYNNLKGRLIFYETNIGNYGVMLITDTPSIGTDAYNLKFKYKTYNKDIETIVAHGEATVTGTFNFDLDTGTQSSSADPLDGTKDFFLHNSIDIVPQNGAKFYVLP